MFVDSWARFTFDISTAPGVRVTWAVQLLPPTRMRPALFGNVASEITATFVTAPAESVTDTVPFWAIVTDCDPGGIVILVSLAAPVSGWPRLLNLKPTT